MKVFQEITPVTNSDVFVMLDSTNKGFNYPIHNHAEFELTLILNASGNRIVGDSSEKYHQQDLVLIGPYLFHKWDDQDQDSESHPDCRVLTLQFDMNLFKGSLLGKLPFKAIQNLLQNASRGIRFMNPTLELAKKAMIKLNSSEGLESIVEFLRLLDILTSSKSYQYLTSVGFEPEHFQANSTRLHVTYQYILRHFKDPNFRMRDIAQHLCLSESAFSHFFKKCTNRNFSNFLIETRLGNAGKLLVDTDHSIAEIGFKSGFNNTSNFNRSFKRKHHCSPKLFRSRYQSKSSFDWTQQITPGQFRPFNSEASVEDTSINYATSLKHH